MNAPDKTWVSASATRNWCIQDPLLDWLDGYGVANGFVPDNLRPGFDPDTDMGLFLKEKGRQFEKAVLDCLSDKVGIVQIASHSRDALDPEMCQATLDAMRRGEPVLYQPVLWNDEDQTFGMPDLLVRSDYLNDLAGKPCIAEEEASVPAASLGEPRWHYRAVDIKFTTLNLSATGKLLLSGSGLSKAAQLLVYNRALARMQGYFPPQAYLVGRGWKTSSGRGDSCLDVLAPVDMSDAKLTTAVDGALAWVRKFRAEGTNWHVLPQPSVDELHPNMSNTKDSPWHMAKKEIAEQIGELTQLWYVSPQKREIARKARIVTFSDTRCDSTVFGLADGYAAKLQKIIEVNRDGCQDLVRPKRITADEEQWREPTNLEFYVDFETVNDLDDSFENMPRKSGQALIYMIGCGHVEDGQWQFKVFTCDRLSEECEAAIIEDWLAHMHAVRQRLMPIGNPTIFHWSHAEVSTLSTAYNSAAKRHGRDWPELSWYDFLVKVMREEPVVVKGSLAFGLKSVAKAMHQHQLIPTVWDNGPTDGLGAMVGAWRCNARAAADGCTMSELPLMQSIAEYNEVDCKVMQEIIAYLRENH